MDDINTKFLEFEKRLKALEKIVFSHSEKPQMIKNDFKGLRGGIRLLIENEFFNEPRALNEVGDELKREGYHYPKPSVSKTLSVDFTNKQKILNRIKNNNQWMYVVRK
jgi:hypothetical protein